MKPLLSASLLVSFWAAAHCAWAQKLPSANFAAEFKSICVSTNAAHNSALAEADKLNRWQPTSERPYAASGDSYAVARIATDSHGPQLLVLEERVGTISGLPIMGASCSMMATVDDPAAVLSFAQNLAGPVRPFAPGHWIFAATDSGPTAITTNQFAAEVLREGRYREVLYLAGDATNPPTALKFTVGRAP